jgi:hypothetical protein
MEQQNSSYDGLRNTLSVGPSPGRTVENTPKASVMAGTYPANELTELLTLRTKMGDVPMESTSGASG